jgi:hypothetical protein
VQFNGFFKRHPLISGALVIMIVKGPEWLSSVWGLYSPAPFIPWMAQHWPLAFLSGIHPSASWITDPIGVFLLFLIWRQSKTPARMPHIVGTWQSQRDAAITLPITQDGGIILARFDGPNHRHDLRGVFDPTTGKFQCLTIRTRKDGSAATAMHGTLEMVDKNTLRATVFGTNGADDLNREYCEPPSDLKRL